MKDYLLKYLESRPPFLALIRAKEAKLFSKYLPLKAPVMDLGCGDGFFAEVVFGRIATGVDIADSRMGEAQSKQVYDRIVEYNGTKLPFHDESFETVVSNCTLEHVEKLEKVVTEAGRVTKPGGRFLTSVMAKPWEDNLAGSMVLGNSYKSWMRKKQVHVNLLSFSEWKWVFEKGGWKVINAVGYLAPRTCRWLDLLHYISIPNLVSYVASGRWTWWPNLIPIEWMVYMANGEVSPHKSGAIFFELQKKRNNRPV